MSIIQEALKKVEPAGKASVTIEHLPAEKISKPRREDDISMPKNMPKAQASKSRRKIFRWALVPAIALSALSVAGIGLFFIFHKVASPAPSAEAGLAVKPDEAPKTMRQDAVYKVIEEYAADKSGSPESAEKKFPDSMVRAQPPDLILNGIMYLETGARAIINNSIVQEGDMIGGATVLLINKNSVILQYNNVEITLNLK